VHLGGQHREVPKATIDALCLTLLVIVLHTLNWRWPAVKD
jgi:hypothetical protein